jgi:hypothetical protein
MTLVGLAVLFLWLTLRVDLVIFAGVLLAVCLRRAAVCASGLTRLPVGWALPTVVLVIITFFAGIGWFFSQAIAVKSTSSPNNCLPPPKRSEA